MPTTAPSSAALIRLQVIEAAPVPETMVAQIAPGADLDADPGRLLDDVAGDRRVGLNRNADARAVGAARRTFVFQIADEVACTTASRPPRLKFVTDTP
jgi:hypothetical protein